MLAGASAVRRMRAGAAAYTHLRQSLAREILLGLEVFVAADIIGTVVDPSWVAIRSVLSFSRQVEIESAWPWQAALSLRPRPGEG